MNIRNINGTHNIELPLQLQVSFRKVLDLYVKYGSEAMKDHPFHESSKAMINEIEKYPELINGFTDISLIEKHFDTISLLLDPLFPEILTNNEIKIASIPFSFVSFKFTERFKGILNNAGEKYNLKVRNLENNLMYIYACTFILESVYDTPVDLKRPFFFDIPDQRFGIMKHYRATFNADFVEVYPTENAPKINKEDIKLLLDNFDNIDIWREKFPPNSYIFKGFGIMNLFDVTSDEAITSIRTNLLKKEDINIIDKLRTNLSEFYSINDLKVGFSQFDISNLETKPPRLKKSDSILVDEGATINPDDFFCDTIISKVFKENEDVVISDIEKYGQKSNKNQFYQRLKKTNIGSIILIPIKASSNKNLILLEIASPRAYELNSVNKQKLKDIIPVFKAASERSSEEFMNILEATIQEYYTSIHSSVKWRFYEAAENYQNAVYMNEEDAKIEQIIFENVFPLYGQIDIKDSSIARNKAIKEDLITQLTSAINVLNKACQTEKLTIYEELIFRIEKYLLDVQKGLKAGDEVGILDFLKKDIYPVFKHIKNINDDFKALVNSYTATLDNNLHVVYDKRKSYEKSVSQINDKLAKILDKRQEEAQEMFPHYFERYKTDGIEYNIYIGQSITNEKKYDSLYLYNLRLWQLITMCEMENIAHGMRKTLSHDLEVASLILVHSNSLAIKFRMEEKKFDVDGAYNIRYEIIKKRIDKSLIKNTNERLTVPGKIAIVYSQDKDAVEYLKYIRFLQSKNMLGAVEVLELEELQGVSGLKALRVEVVYSSDTDTKETITIDELLLNEFKESLKKE